ncbi:MAG: toxin-antitoxin system YwqK family antitoxin [Aureispira sp.]|nr:toxin-antitoxin system YwqK family antitoxin [Aureispira sp.]
MKQAIIFLGLIVLILQSCGTEPATNNGNTTDNVDAEAKEQPMEITVKTEKDSTGAMLLEYEYDKTTGVKHGFYKEYHENGKVSKELTFKKDKMDGVEKTYYENGTVSATFEVKEGMYDGVFKEYFEDGTLKQEGTYAKDEYQGELKTYYADGTLKEMVTMLDNLEQGPFIEYNKNGTLKAKGSYMSKGEEITALETGPLEEYDKDGTLTTKRICKEGQCCEIWNSKDGDVKPSSKMCEAVINSAQAQ